MGDADTISHDDSGDHPHQDALSDSSICLLWRCVHCGAAQLGTLDRKPERCLRCGSNQFEDAAED